MTYSTRFSKDYSNQNDVQGKIGRKINNRHNFDRFRSEYVEKPA